MYPTRTFPLLAAAVLLAAGCATDPPPADPLEPYGIRYAFHLRTEPRLARFHVLHVQLANRRTALRAVIAPDPDGDGPAQAALTHPLKLVEGQPVLAFVNTNPWDSFPDADGQRNRRWYAGQPVEITGLAASNSVLVSPPSRHYAAVWSDSRRRVRLGIPPPGADIVEGFSGWAMILQDGVVTAKADDRLNPLTGMGTDADGRTLWLVVADGRQPGVSEGITRLELALFLQELGARHGVVMDGGGSSVMGLRGPDGAVRVVNSPSDRFLGVSFARPLPLLLTIQER